MHPYEWQYQYQQLEIGRDNKFCKVQKVRQRTGIRASPNRSHFVIYQVLEKLWFVFTGVTSRHSHIYDTQHSGMEILPSIGYMENFLTGKKKKKVFLFHLTEPRIMSLIVSSLCIFLLSFIYYPWPGDTNILIVSIDCLPNNNPIVERDKNCVGLKWIDWTLAISLSTLSNLWFERKAKGITVSLFQVSQVNQTRKSVSRSLASSPRLVFSLVACQSVCLSLFFGRSL